MWLDITFLAPWSVKKREHRCRESSTFGIWIDMGTLFLDLDFACTLFTYSPRSGNQDWHRTCCLSLMSSVPLCAQGMRDWEPSSGSCSGHRTPTSFSGNLDSSPSEDRLELRISAYSPPTSFPPLLSATPSASFFKYQKDQEIDPWSVWYTWRLWFMLLVPFPFHLKFHFYLLG